MHFVGWMQLHALLDRRHGRLDLKQHQWQLKSSEYFYWRWTTVMLWICVQCFGLQTPRGGGGGGGGMRTTMTRRKMMPARYW